MFVWLRQWWQKPYAPVLFLIACTSIYLGIYGAVFGFHRNNDTESYIDTIVYFRGYYGDVLFWPPRYLSPWYAVVGATIFRFLSPAYVLIITNIIALFAVVLGTYGTMKRVFQHTRYALLVALFILTHYAWVRYGLTQVQDLGGYMWYVLGLYTAVRWYTTDDKKQRVYWSLLVGVCVSFGLLTKETGAMSALFFAVLVFLRPGISWIQKGVYAVLGGFMPLITVGINQWRGHSINFTSKEWYLYNWQAFGGDYTLVKWIGVNVTSFHILGLCALVGIGVFIRRWGSFEQRIRDYFIAILIPSFSYLAWPSFISRTVVISAWCIVPLSVLALEQFLQKNGCWKKVGMALCVTACITPMLLQYTLRYAPMFQLVSFCRYHPVCVWQQFWQERNRFSTSGEQGPLLFNQAP